MAFAEPADDLSARAKTIMGGMTESRVFWRNLADELVVYGDGRVSVKLQGLDTVWIFLQEGEENNQIPCN